MDDVFVNYECQSTRKKKTLCKKKKFKHRSKLNHKQHLSLVFYSICLFVYVPFFISLSSCSFVCFFVFSRVLISYTFYLVFHFNCIKRPVFKAPEFPYIQYKHCNRYLYQPATSLQLMAGFLCYFYLC